MTAKENNQTAIEDVRSPNCKMEATASIPKKIKWTLIWTLHLVPIGRIVSNLDPICNVLIVEMIFATIVTVIPEVAEEAVITTGIEAVGDQVMTAVSTAMTSILDPAAVDTDDYSKTFTLSFQSR